MFNAFFSRIKFPSKPQILIFFCFCYDFAPAVLAWFGSFRFGRPAQAVLASLNLELVQFEKFILLKNEIKAWVIADRNLFYAIEIGDGILV